MRLGCVTLVAELLARLRRSGQELPIKDSLIAATALVHGFIVLRNTRDFKKGGRKGAGPVLDPFT
jgi:predicted nucleic acid-binding protein